MKTLPATMNKLSLAISAAAFLTTTLPSFSSIIGPYVPDANTVVLLHLDEPAPAGITTNGVVGASGFVASANPTAASPRQPLPGLLGATGASGLGFDFGLCADLTFSNSVGIFMDAN